MTFDLGFDTDNQLLAFINKIQEYMDICAPLKEAKISPKQAIRNKWMTTGLLKSSNNICKMRKNVAGKADAHPDVPRYKKYRNLYNRLIRLTKSKYYGELFIYYKSNIRSIWRTLNEIIGKASDKSSCLSMKLDGATVTNPDYK